MSLRARFAHVLFISLCCASDALAGDATNPAALSAQQLLFAEPPVPVDPIPDVADVADVPAEPPADGLLPTVDLTAETIAQLRNFEAQLDKKAGTIELGDGLATFTTGDEYRFLSPQDAGSVLQAWGNPVDTLPLGMIVPAQQSVFATDAWAVILNFDDDGYVSDEDADSVDYDEILQDMKDGIVQENQTRKEQGFAAVNLVGWAEPPSYSAVTHKMYWAKDLQFGDADEHTLNYNIRVLGRRGVLELNAVASMSQLALVKPGMEKLMGAVSFQDGHRYTDFDPDMDHVAAYGLGALVAGGVAAKAGLFKGLLALLIAGKKVLILGFAAGAAGLKRFLGGREAGSTRKADSGEGADQD